MSPRAFLLAAAATAAGVAAQGGGGSGAGGDVCGDTGLGFAGSLVAAATGWGQAVETGSAPFWMAIDGPQIVTNTFADSNCNPVTSTTPCAVASKFIECVFDVTIDYGTSQLQVITGPPGTVKTAGTTNPQHRCWIFGITESQAGKSVAYNRGAPGSNCSMVTSPSAAGVTPLGTLGASGTFSSTLRPGYGAACADSVTGNMAPSALPSNNTAASGNSFWLQPIALSLGPNFGTNVDAARAHVQCLSGGVVVEPSPLRPVFALSPVGAPNDCVVVKQSLNVGIVQVKRVINTACSAVTSAPSSWDFSLSATFANWTAPAPASGAPAAAVAPPTELKVAPVVTYSLPLSGQWSALTVADPCTGVPLRQAAADAMAKSIRNPFSIAGISFGVINDGTVSITLAPNSPVNTLTSAPANCVNGQTPSARRLGAQQPAVAVAAVAAASEVPRRLQVPPNIGVVAQAPIGTTNDQMAAAMTSNPAAPSMATVPGMSSVASSPPTGTTAASVVVAVQIVYPPRKNPYVVDPLIKEFHSLPRICLVGCTGQATNKFELSVTYGQGAVGIAAGLFALAVISLLIYSIAYICGLCACGGCRCRKARDPATLRHICSPRSMYIIFGIVNIGLILACLAYLSRFPLGLQQLSDGLDYFSGNFTLASNYMQNLPCDVTSSGVSSPHSFGTLATCSVKTFDFVANADTGVTPPSVKTPHDVRSVWASGSIAKKEVLTLQGACAGVCPSAVTSILTAVDSGNTIAVNMAGTISELLDLVGTLMGGASKSLNVATYKPLIVMGGYGVLGLLAGFVAIYTVFVCKSTCACCVHGISSFATIVLVSILMIIAGIFYAVGVIGADICYDPNGTLVTLAASNGLSGGMAGDTLNYYLTCGANPAQAPIGAAGMISGVVAQVQGAAAQVKTLKEQADVASLNGPLAPLGTATPDYTGVTATTFALTSLSAHMGYSADAVASLAGVMSCSTIDPILSTLWTGACTNGVATIIGIARILIVASVLLFIQLGIGIDMCCFHPGLTSRYWAEEGVNPEGDGGDGGKPGGVTIRQSAV